MKKSLFKLVTALLIIAIAFGLCLACGCKQSDENSEGENGNGADGNGNSNLTIVNNIGIMADIQLNTSAKVAAMKADEGYEDYRLFNSFNTSIDYTEAIFLSAVDDYIASGVKTMFLIGDLTQDGDQASMNVIKQGCEKFKAAGINVFTTVGICDRYPTSCDSFISYFDNCEKWNVANFADDFFGYMGAEPYSVDTGSCSYAVNIPNTNISLISFDASVGLKFGNEANTHYWQQNSSATSITQTVTDDLMTWLENALLSAKMQNNIPVIVSYFPFDDDMSDIMGSTTNIHFMICDRFEELRNLCINYNVAAVFSGQLHMEFENTYVNESGSLSEFSVGSLATYPLPMATYSLMNNDTFQKTSSKRLTSVNGAYLPSSTPADIKNTLTTDAVAYAKARVKDGFVTKWNVAKNGWKDSSWRPIAEGLLTTLSLYDKGNETCLAVEKTINDWMVAVNDLPLYGEGTTMEAICLENGVTLPQTRYTSVRDYMCEMVCSMYDGTFDMSPESTNSAILKYTFYCGFYLLAEIDPFGLFKSLDASIIDCDIMPTLRKVFAEDVVDLKINDLLCSLVSVAAVPINKMFKRTIITVQDTASYLKVLDTLAPLAFSMLAESYDAEAETVWGIPYKEHVNFKEGLININALFYSMSPQFITTNAFRSI